MDDFDQIHKNLMYSMLGTTLAEITTLPICTTKVHFQNQSLTNRLSIKDTVKSIYKSYGVRGFYSASVPAITSQVFTTSSKYVVYKHICNKYGGNKYVNNTIGGICISLMSHPIDCIKVNTQMQITNLFSKIKKSGLSFLYRGYTKTLTKVCISSPLFFPLAEELTEKTGNTTVGSALASVVGTTAMQPLDYMKNRQMVKNPIWQGYDPRIYFRGLTLNLIRVVPHFTIIMTTISVCNKKFD